MKDNEAINNVIAAIEKQFGKGSIISSDSTTLPGIEFISSGCISLDRAMGGGFARGRIVEVLGWESSGKSSLALHVIAEAQKTGATCAFIDAEHALDLKYSESLGVDPSKLLISQPDSAEEALGIVDLLVQSGTMDVVVVDSVAALVPKAELEGDIGDSHMGLQARLMGQALRKLTGVISKTNTLVIFTNQLRLKIGVVFGNPEVSSGGMGLKFYASQRLDIRSVSKNTIGDDITSITSRVKVIKNKVAPPFKQAEFQIEFGKGINKYQDLLTVAVESNIIEKAGSWYSYNGSRIGQGEPLMIDWLKANPDKFKEIFNKCK